MPITPVQTIIDRTRRMVGDWPDIDTTTTSLASTSSLVSVADGTIYPKNFHVEIDNEIMTVTVAGVGTVFNVRRGAWGTTAATHVAGSEIRIRPAWSNIQILDAINQAKDEAFPLIYQPVLDTSLITLSNTFEYTVPTMSGIGVPIPYISKIELKVSGTQNYFEVRGWSIRRGATPKIQFVDLQDTGSTIRVHGYGPFTDLVFGGNQDILWPANADKILPVGAAATLLASGEARRARADTLANDAREQANRPGASLSISNALYGRFRSMVLAAAMPPLPKHAKPTF